MESKTQVRIKNGDGRYGEYYAGEEGYIDGYVQGGDNAPYACVVIDDRIVLVPIHNLIVIPYHKIDSGPK